MTEITLVSAKTVANEFLRLAREEGSTVTNMKLQKLVYIAEGWYLALYDLPLYREDTVAWKYGPVIPELYEALRMYGSGEVTEAIPYAALQTYGLGAETEAMLHAALRKYESGEKTAAIPLEAEEALTDRMKAHIKEVWEAYKKLSGLELSAMTHREGTPWAQTTRESAEARPVINPNMIQDYYKKIQKAQS